MTRLRPSLIANVAALVLLSTLASGCGDRRSSNTEIHIAVASNFAGAMKALADSFKVKTGYELILNIGSTGKHYAQVKNGAPFDVYFAADGRRPELLEKEGLTVGGSRFTYATGRLVLWSRQPDYVDPHGDVLTDPNFRHLAIANPQLAPYGRAAQEVLETRGLWDQLQQRVVQGENISQAYQFVRSGNAELGFVAYSQVVNFDGPGEGSWWEVPSDLHLPIDQQAVLLSDNPIAVAFLDFVRSEEARKMIRQHGYGTP